MTQTPNTKNLIDICESDIQKTEDRVDKGLRDLLIKSLKKAPTKSPSNFFFRTLTFNKNTDREMGKQDYNDGYTIETKLRSENSDSDGRRMSEEFIKLGVICQNQHKKIEYLNNENLRYLSENKRLTKELRSIKLQVKKKAMREDKVHKKKLEELVRQLEKEKELQAKKIVFLNKKIEENTVSAYEKDNIITVLNQQVEEITNKYEQELRTKQNTSSEKGKFIFNIKSLNEINQKNLEWSFAEKTNGSEANMNKLKEKQKSTEDFLHKVMVSVREFFIDSNNNHHRDRIKSLYQHYITNYIEKQLIVADRNTA